MSKSPFDQLRVFCAALDDQLQHPPGETIPQDTGINTLRYIAEDLIAQALSVFSTWCHVRMLIARLEQQIDKERKFN